MNETNSQVDAKQNEDEVLLIEYQNILGHFRVKCYKTHRYPIEWPEYFKNNADGAMSIL